MGITCTEIRNTCSGLIPPDLLTLTVIPAGVGIKYLSYLFLFVLTRVP